MLIQENFLRYREMKRLLNLSMAAFIAAMLLTLSSISLITGHDGLCHNLARQVTDQHSECHHHNDVCNESDEPHQHLHEFINTRASENTANFCSNLPVVFLETLPTDSSGRKPETRPPEKPDQLFLHASQVLLI